jgi:hypothetical protein
MQLRYILPFLLASLLFTGCSDEEELKELFQKQIDQIKRANAAHVKIIEDKDAQLYKAEVLNARAQGYISTKLSNDALDTLKVQSEIFPKLKKEDSDKIEKEIAATKSSPSYERQLLGQDTRDILNLNIEIPKDITSYNDAQSSILKTEKKIENIALPDAKKADEDGSYFGFGRLIYGLKDGFRKLIIFIAMIAIILFGGSFILSVYPPTAPVGSLLAEGTKMGFTFVWYVVYYLLIWPIVTIIQVILNDLTAPVKTTT